MAKKIIRAILITVVVLVAIALFLFYTKPGNVVKDWFTGFFVSEQVGDQNGNGSNNANHITHTYTGCGRNDKRLKS